MRKLIALTILLTSTRASATVSLENTRYRMTLAESGVWSSLVDML